MEFSRIETLAGVKRTIYNQYESLVLPLQSWLKTQGLKIVTGCKVTGLEHQSVAGMFNVTGIHCLRQGLERYSKHPLSGALLAAAKFSQASWITEMFAEKSPEQKLAIVRKESAAAKTLYVGDGINDAPAMMAATVGIAAVGQNSDVTAEAAGVVVMELP